MIEKWVEKTTSKNEVVRKEINLTRARRDGGALCAAVDDLSGQVDVTEVYSPPRVTVMAAKTGLTPGSAMDLRTGYDFSREKDRDRARQ